MMNIHRHPTLTLSIALAGLLGLTACSESPRETAKDVDEASRERTESVSEAERDLSQAIAEGNEAISNAAAEGEHDVTRTVIDPDSDREDVADATREAVRKFDETSGEALERNAEAAYDLAIAKAKGDLDVATEQCDGYDTMAERNRCKDAAETTYEAMVDKANAELERAEKLAEIYKD